MDNYIVRKISEVRKKKYYHKYYDKDDNELKDNKLINFLKKGIYIPPAYDNVRINYDINDKVRAIGYDTKDRSQYIYNKDFIEKQKNKKFDHMVDFGRVFNKINKKITEDYLSPIESKEKQVAIILKLIMDCHFRVGNDRYTGNSYGTTTLENKHIKIKKKDEVEIDFIGKKNVRNKCTIRNKNLVKTLKNKKRSLQKNDRIFTYRRGNKYYTIKSTDVNNYLKQFGNITTKNFRTWGANIEFIIQILRRCKDKTINYFNLKKDKKEIIKKSIETVAFKLHHTCTVCKNNYLDPLLIDLFMDNTSDFFDLFYTKGTRSYNRDNITKKYVYFLEDL
tara:strand:- start:2294 stop:3298 length:1005 start_codon:yes stop_codon:yes gene_type:complete